ncbi:hypothetical protein JCM11251_000422 [Rhodosporidiobolus azoricus]
MKGASAALTLAAGLLVAGPVAFAQATTVGGTLETGPTSQGSCSAAGMDAFLCSNGAFCSWQAASLNFSCVGGTGAVEETSTFSEGPPGRTCTAHLDHWDCEDGSFCEYVDGAWACEGGSAESSESGSGSTCVVHGGHTHGDCSDSCNGVDLGEYDMGLHIAAVFIVLISSAIGVFLPLLASRYITKSLFSKVFFAAKHFGTGIIISTAFVHLLYHSFIMFGNACLGELAFEPAAAAIAMSGTYVVFTVDFFVMRWLKARGDQRAAAAAAAGADGPSSASSHDSFVHPFDEDEAATTPRLPEVARRYSGEKAAHQAPAPNFGHNHGPAPNEHTDFASPQAHFDVTILEAGIIFHSIMIGVSLGASGGSQWVPLFCAIIFHQMFEGLALGSRIGQLIFAPGKGWRRWVMGGAFTLITPIGVAIGIGVHSAYNPNSGAALLSIGVLDSISAGILIYGGIVEMLYHDFMHGELARAGMIKVAAAFFFLLAGSLCMSVLGKWA